MDVSINLDGAEAVRDAFRTARPKLIARWYDTTRRHALRAVRIIQTKYRGAESTSATATRQGTGNLRASYAEQTALDATGVETRIGLMRTAARGQALRYGAVHEEGATIRPVRAQRLAIPLPTIRSPSGIAPKPSDFPRKDTFVLKGKFGGGIIARRLGNGVIQPLFALRRQVVIRARPPGGAINAAFREIESDLQQALEADAVTVVGGAP